MDSFLTKLHVHPEARKPTHMECRFFEEQSVTLKAGSFSCRG